MCRYHINPAIYCQPRPVRRLSPAEITSSNQYLPVIPPSDRDFRYIKANPEIGGIETQLNQYRRIRKSHCYLLVVGANAAGISKNLPVFYRSDFPLTIPLLKKRGKRTRHFLPDPSRFCPFYSFLSICFLLTTTLLLYHYKDHNPVCSSLWFLLLVPFGSSIKLLQTSLVASRGVSLTPNGTGRKRVFYFYPPSRVSHTSRERVNGFHRLK